jgi:uncharacterized protein
MKGFISKDLHPFWVILLLLAFMTAGYFIASFVYSLIVNWIYGISIFELVEVVENPASHPNGPSAMLMFQGVVQFFSFVIAPLYLLKSFGYNLDTYLNWKIKPGVVLTVLSGLLIILIMPANSLVIDWNANMELPAFLDEFARWARAKEDELAELTKLIADFRTMPKLLVGILVIAAIPAIGEELVFRGVLQRQLHRWTNNTHVAIWVAAIVFAAIHMQFFGFVPRALFGALFGYLYFWSGRISIPILAHFINNGFTVVLLHLQQTGKIDFDVESTDAMPWITVLLSLILTVGVLYYLYQQFSPLPVREESIAEAEAGIRTEEE